MTHQITEKINLLEEELKKVVEAHNEHAKVKDQLFNKATEIQGALKALKELDHEHEDQPANTEAS